MSIKSSGIKVQGPRIELFVWIDHVNQMQVVFALRKTTAFTNIGVSRAWHFERNILISQFLVELFELNYLIAFRQTFFSELIY